MKKRIFALLMAFVLLLAACGNKTEKTTDTDKKSETNEKKETKKITFVLDYTPNTNHTGIYVADELGYFKEEGLELEIVQPPEDGAESLVAAGKAQFGVSYQDTIAGAYAQEDPIPVTHIAALVQHNTSGIITLKDKNVNSPKDLEGLSYATWGIPVEQAIMKNVVETDGGDFSKVQLKPSNFTDVFTGLETDIDAVWIFYAWDGIAAKIKNIETNYFAFKDINDTFDYYTPTLITSNKLIEEDPETVKAFLRAAKKGYEFSIEKPEEAAKILVQRNPELDQKLVVESQKYLAKEYIADAKKWGEIDPARWNKFYKWLFDNKLIEKEIPADFGFSNEYLPE